MKTYTVPDFLAHKNKYCLAECFCYECATDFESKDNLLKHVHTDLCPSQVFECHTCLIPMSRQALTSLDHNCYLKFTVQKFESVL